MVRICFQAIIRLFYIYFLRLMAEPFSCSFRVFNITRNLYGGTAGRFRDLHDQNNYLFNYFIHFYSRQCLFLKKFKSGTWLATEFCIRT